MFCSKCGSEIHDEAVICPKCGCPTANYNNKSTGLNKDLTLDDLKNDPYKNKKITASVLLVLTLFNMFNPYWQVTRFGWEKYMYKSFADWSDTFGIIILVVLVIAIACLWIKKRTIALVAGAAAMLMIMYVSVAAIGSYGSLSFWGVVLIITSIGGLIPIFMIKE